MATLTQEHTGTIPRYIEELARIEADAKTNGQAWLTGLRQEGMDRFTARGFPTTKDEDWRFTNLAPIARTPFGRPGAMKVAAGALAPFTFDGLACPRLVFVNGRFAPSLSTLDGLPKGARVSSLAEAAATDRGALQPHLGRYAETAGDPFVALNAALMEDGAFISIPRGVALDQPIHLLYVSVAGGGPTAAHTRNLILAGDESQAAVIEDHVSLGEGVTFSNAVTELVAAEGSIVHHYLIGRENRQSFHVNTLRSQLGRSSSLTSHSLLTGGALTRRNIHPVLGGEGAECQINGLFMVNGRQHTDNFMRVEHASPHCDSRQFYKGILDGQSRGVFHGRIVVHKDAQKTDAKQTNMNLLLSEGAQVDTKPQLEIYADDVKCTHGATVGQIDEDAIFYLRARGIPQAAAKALLLYAFAGEVLQRMKVDAVRKHLEGLVSRWMPQGNLLEEL
jgi:Fe-S cluster assembly protein SufD